MESKTVKASLFIAVMVGLGFTIEIIANSITIINGFFGSVSKMIENKELERIYENNSSDSYNPFFSITKDQLNREECMILQVISNDNEERNHLLFSSAERFIRNNCEEIKIKRYGNNYSEDITCPKIEFIVEVVDTTIGRVKNMTTVHINSKINYLSTDFALTTYWEDDIYGIGGDPHTAYINAVEKLLSRVNFNN